MRSSRTLADIYDYLQNLPEDLNIYYHQAWERAIGHRNPRDVQRARAILCWITHAKRVMSFESLRSAIAIQSCDGIPYAPRNSLGENVLISFVHYSAEEYFQAREEVLFPHAEDAITRTCIRHLADNNTELASRNNADFNRC